MKESLLNENEGVGKEFEELAQEISAEKADIHELEKIVEHEKKELHHLEEKLEHLEKSQHHHQHNVYLVFIINGQPQKVEAKEDWLLKRAVELALKKSGNEGRPIDDWAVRWNNKELDLNKEIREYRFPECVDLFLSLKAGQGGNLESRPCRW